MISGFLFQSFFASACCMGRYLGWGSGGLAVNMIIVFAGRRDKVFGCWGLCDCMSAEPLGGAIRILLFGDFVRYGASSALFQKKV